METWKYYDITHKDHLICNPSSPAKLRQLIDLLQPTAGTAVLELACGKGELLTRLAERARISGVGVDLSPYCIRDTAEKLAARAPTADIKLLELDGAAYQPPALAHFDISICLGASWIFNGHRGTLAALQGMTKPGGMIVVGEPFWLREPAPAYLELAGFSADAFGSHHQNVVTGQELGLTLLYTIVSSDDDWDQYESLQWYASERYALSHPDDPDVPELLRRQHRDQKAYLQYGRDSLGWAIYLFQQTMEVAKKL